ncbi:hypothetical protein IF2G_01668 [Cordyceps javanica]|nr:hypothetical protein IF2G_01668 [Cordyceps javanica]
MMLCTIATIYLRAFQDIIIRTQWALDIFYQHGQGGSLITRTLAHPNACTLLYVASSAHPPV